MKRLRRKLIRFLNGASLLFPKITLTKFSTDWPKTRGRGVAVRNVGTYCYEIARLVLLEALKRSDSRPPH